MIREYMILHLCFYGMDIRWWIIYAPCDFSIEFWILICTYSVSILWYSDLKCMLYNDVDNAPLRSRYANNLIIDYELGE